jgi:hypothetical protein
MLPLPAIYARCIPLFSIQVKPQCGQALFACNEDHPGVKLFRPNYSILIEEN